MAFQLTIYQVACGDAIDIQFEGASGVVRHLFIDSGYMGTYYEMLDMELANFPKDQRLDWWILTHLDADHINGAVAFIRDGGVAERKDFVGELWFNFFGEFKLASDSEQIAWKEAIEIRDKLKGLGCQSVRRDLTNETGPIDLDGAKLTILSPDLQTLKKLEAGWEEFEADYKKPETPENIAGVVTYPDDHLTIAKLASRRDKKAKKSDTVNRSSIAFLLEYQGECLLMLGDAHPLVVADALKKLLKERGLKKLPVTYTKLGHHGSIVNYHKELFELIECDDMIISSNGVNKHKIPNKETLAKILVRENRDKTVNFYFNYDEPRYHAMFKADQDSAASYKFSLRYPEPDESFIKVPYASK